MLQLTRMSASIGAFSFGTIRTATVILLSFVAATACHGSGSERLKALPPPADLFAGEWNVTSSTSTDTCHLGSVVQPLQGRYSIQVNGASLSLSAVCIFFSATGTWDGTVVMIQSNRTHVSSSTCSWQIDEVDAGTLDAGGDGFRGGASLTVSAIGDCGPGFPCQVHGTFTAERCRGTACGVLNCLLRLSDPRTLSLLSPPSALPSLALRVCPGRSPGLARAREPMSREFDIAVT